MSAGQIIAEKLKGKTSSSDRIPVLQRIIKEYRKDGASARMDIFVQATSMLAAERSKTKKISRTEPMCESAMGLLSGKAILGLGGC